MALGSRACVATGRHVPIIHGRRSKLSASQIACTRRSGEGEAVCINGAHRPTADIGGQAQAVSALAAKTAERLKDITCSKLESYPPTATYHLGHAWVLGSCLAHPNAESFGHP
jgi:hypothetical protein